jgi:hypothetical protein
MASGRQEDVPSYNDLPEMVTPEEASAFLRISRNAMYAALKNMPHVTIGRQIRIRKQVLIGEQP